MARGRLGRRGFIEKVAGTLAALGLSRGFERCYAAVRAGGCDCRGSFAGKFTSAAATAEGSARGGAAVGGVVPSRRVYGLMADAARVPEKLEYYRRLIDFCADWSLNALVFRLTDDQGSVLRFQSHPELITHRSAFSPDQLHRLAEYGREHGVDLIPEVESFGHSRYITGVPQHSDLSDRDPQGRKNFTGLCPVNPGTLRLLEDLYHEVAAIFPSRYLHGGCDEVNWGGSELSRKALKSRSRTEIWAEYLNTLNGFARGQGKSLIVWGDYVLRTDPGVLPLLYKDVIIMDWNYSEVNAEAVETWARKTFAAGHRVIGAPALIQCRWGPRAGSEQLRNIDAYGDAYRSIADPRCLGVIVTNWLPCRYLQRSVWDGFAYAAVAVREGSGVARRSALQRFVHKHYAAEWSESWADVFRMLYNNAPYREVCSESWQLPKLPVPWHNEQDLSAVIKGGLMDAPPYTTMRRLLVPCEAEVRKNLEDFDSLRLCVEYLEYIFWRNTSLVREARSSEATQDSAALLIKTIAERDQRLVSLLDAEWNKGRPSDAAAKRGPVYDFRLGDQMLYTLRIASEFSAKLAQQPERFFRLLKGTAPV